MKPGVDHTAIQFVEGYRFDVVMGNAVLYISACREKLPSANQKQMLAMALYFIDRGIWQATNGLRQHAEVPQSAGDPRVFCESLQLDDHLYCAINYICDFQRIYVRDLAHDINMLHLAIGAINQYILNLDGQTTKN